jgi:hypothetical protein
MKRPLVIEEERINFNCGAQEDTDEDLLLMAASMEDGKQR